MSLPARLAALHAKAFDRPWDAATFEGLLAQDGVVAFERDRGFVLVRVVADEAEILTLAVEPPARRRGLGRTLVEGAAELAHGLGAEKLHLEVAEDNAAAIALYRAAGFVEAGRRPGYYPRSDGPAAAALILTLDITERLPTPNG